MGKVIDKVIYSPLIISMLEGENKKLEKLLKTKQRKIEYQQQIIENLKTEIQDQKALIKSLRGCNK